MVGGLALLALAIAIFGSGKYLQEHSRLVVVFNSSIMGLSMGSPVVFKGVPVGRVADILLSGNEETLVFTTPVVIELDLEKTARFVNDMSEGSSLQFLERMVRHGFRARLASQSFLTGQLLVELDFYPPEEFDNAHVEKLQFFNGLPEIPAIPSRLDSLLQRLRSMPVETIIQNVLNVSEKLDLILNDAAEQNLSGNLNALLLEVKLVAKEVSGILQEARPVVGSYKRLADTANRKLDDSLSVASSTLNDLDSLVRETEKAVMGIRTLTNANSASVVEFNRTLREVAEAAKAIRSLSNMLDRNPEVLLRGKGASRQ